jgi:hypothetical protein
MKKSLSASLSFPLGIVEILFLPFFRKQGGEIGEEPLEFLRCKAREGGREAPVPRNTFEVHHVL